MTPLSLSISGRALVCLRSIKCWKAKQLRRSMVRSYILISTRQLLSMQKNSEEPEGGSMNTLKRCGPSASHHGD